jgi:hypothetical protein
MEAIERIVDNNDWMTLLLLGIVFLIVIASLINYKRLQQLFALPYNDYYLLNYSPPIWNSFNTSLFIASNLILSLFVYLFIEAFYPNKIFFSYAPFIRILSIVFGYWVFKYGIGKLISYLFELQNWQKSLIFTKISYFFSVNLYLLIFLVFVLYFFEKQAVYILIFFGLYAILLLIRYYHFLRLYKREIFSHLFYFILYLCALEIAPLLIAIKIGI